MKIWKKSADAVIELHKRGFTDDFQLLNNALLWVQGKAFIKSGEFVICEHHIIRGSKSRMNKLIVCGIVAPFHSAKGILISRSKSYKRATPLPELPNLRTEL